MTPSRAKDRHRAASIRVYYTGNVAMRARRGTIKSIDWGHFGARLGIEWDDCLEGESPTANFSMDKLQHCGRDNIGTEDLLFLESDYQRASTALINDLREKGWIIKEDPL